MSRLFCKCIVNFAIEKNGNVYEIELVGYMKNYVHSGLSIQTNSDLHFILYFVIKGGHLDGFSTHF